MKYKYPVLITFSLIFFFGWATFSRLQERENPFQKLDLVIKPSKSTYLTGEVITLNFQLTNKSGEEVNISNKFSVVEDAFLNVYISQDGKNFKKNVNPGRRVDSSGANIKIKPGDSIETTASILWNDKPKVSHLNPDAAKSITEGKILTDYVFPQAGVYFIKSIYSVYYYTDRMNVVKIESAPVQIRIEEPTGNDWTVWNKIKDRGDFAYFIQYGDFRVSEPEEREKLQQEIERIFSQSPEGIIAGQIEQSLEKFKVIEEKSKVFLQKLKEARQKKPQHEKE